MNFRKLQPKLYAQLWSSDTYERIQEEFRYSFVTDAIQKYIHKYDGTTNRIMEVGPGYYPIFPRIKNWHNVTVIEPLSECVQSLMRKFKNYQGVEFCEITLENYLLENQKTFDFISLVGVLHEIEDYEVIFEKISNLLTLNGILVVVIPNSDSLHRFAHRSIDEDDSEEHISNAYGNLIIRKNEILDLYHNFNFSNLYTSSFTLKPFTHELMHRLLSADSELLKNWIELNQNSEFTKKYGSELILIGQKQ